jgi:hypothetical protein
LFVELLDVGSVRLVDLVLCYGWHGSTIIPLFQEERK